MGCLVVLRKSYAGCNLINDVEVNRNDRALEMQLEVILSLPSSWNVGHGSWLLNKDSTLIIVSTPYSVKHHITRDTLLRLVAVQVLLFSTLHGSPVYRLHRKGYISLLGCFWPELFTKIAASPQLIIIHHLEQLVIAKDLLFSWVLSQSVTVTFLKLFMVAMGPWPTLALQVMLLLVPTGQRLMKMVVCLTLR